MHSSPFHRADDAARPLRLLRPVAVEPGAVEPAPLVAHLVDAWCEEDTDRVDRICRRAARQGAPLVPGLAAAHGLAAELIPERPTLVHAAVRVLAAETGCLAGRQLVLQTLATRPEFLVISSLEEVARTDTAPWVAAARAALPDALARGERDMARVCMEVAVRFEPDDPRTAEAVVGALDGFPLEAIEQLMFLKSWSADVLSRVSAWLDAQPDPSGGSLDEKLVYVRAVDLLSLGDEAGHHYLSDEHLARSNPVLGEALEEFERRVLASSAHARYVLGQEFPDAEDEPDDERPGAIERDGDRPRPNRPCPCGSGRKAKRCCGP